MRASKIEAIKSEIKSEINDSIKDLCRKLIAELFTCKQNSEQIYWGYGHYEKIRTVAGEMRSNIFEFVKDEAVGLCKKEAEQLIDGEAFIDSIVERISKKQLAVG